MFFDLSSAMPVVGHTDGADWPPLQFLGRTRTLAFWAKALIGEPGLDMPGPVLKSGISGPWRRLIGVGLTCGPAGMLPQGG